MRSDFAAPLCCDIFCAVVDNYGDIGVCWRLARQLANEHGVAVRLWVDVLASFHRLCPDVDVQLSQQYCRGVEIRHWTKVFPEVKPAQWVIEAFACKLPESYVAAMAVLKHKPVWINLEYLSAEDWVEGCHTLPSPHPSLPLVKYFFANSWYGLLSKPGYHTYSTCGCASSHFANTKALSTWRCTRKLSVSIPCNNRNELNGLIDGPKSLKPSTLARMANAMLGSPSGLPSPNTSQNFRPW